MKKHLLTLYLFSILGVGCHSSQEEENNITSIETIAVKELINFTKTIKNE